MNESLIYAQNNTGIIIEIIKTFFFIIFSYYTNYKICNKEMKLNIKTLLKSVSIIFVAFIYLSIKMQVSHVIGLISLMLMIALIFSIENIGKSIIATIISLSINYVISIITIILCFVINKILNLNNDVVYLVMITTFQIILLIGVLKSRKFKYGIGFLTKSKNDENFDILILSTSVIILLSIILIRQAGDRMREKFTVLLVILPLIMFITIQKSFQLYYKQKLLQKDLDETKEELENKEKEIKELEAENIKISKKSHTLVHKQNSLQYKLEQMANSTEISKEEVAEVRERLNEIEKDLYKEKTTIQLDKTEIPEIDNMLEYMQSECEKNKIDFELQLKGNIHYMTNNLISKEDLETLLADHIKNAIIAINHTDNVNRSILVRLGEIDGIYSLYIYDTGIEFQKETLENLGKKPSTTHKDEGGTGMGFMNTFDTLRKYNASLTIDRIGAPSKDNYTKAIIIKFEKGGNYGYYY